MIILTDKDSECSISPDIGGSIAQWIICGQNMLRAATEQTLATRQILGMAAFPLVPFSNRIGSGRFIWQGRVITLAKNFPPEPHSIHGTGWQSVWSATHVKSNAVLLSLTHDSDDRWPWPFKAEQKLTLTDKALILELSVHNLADHSAPVAFGYHPYFDTEGATLEFSAERVWMSDSDNLPTHAIKPDGQFDFSTAAAVEGRDVDNGYVGCNSAHIRWHNRPWSLKITASTLVAVVYIPGGGDAFCFEPVPHMNNALNMPDQHPAMPVIAAGDTYRSTIQFQAMPA